MSIIQHTRVPAGWYSDGVADGSLRWWDGTDWTHDVRPIAAPVLVPVLSMDVEYVAGESMPVQPVSVEISHDLPGLLASVPERRAPVQPSTLSALSRRQLREMLGGPLVTDTPSDQ